MTVKRLPTLATFAVVFLFSTPVAAQSMTGGSTNPLNLIVILAGLAVLPFLLIMVTSFVKVAVVLSILRQAIGAQKVPPNQVITGLSIVLSLYIMAPVGYDIYRAVGPDIRSIQQDDAEWSLDAIESMTTEGIAPLRQFLSTHSDTEERRLLYELAVELHASHQQQAGADTPRMPIADDSLLVLIPAFVVTELKEAFTIGFILFVPFIIIDLVVANVLLSLGMHMLSPTTISLPFKLLLFVLVDGWFLVVKGLVLGYTPA
ncbi:MAG: type III secretion system export apparatus subunit SctR [Bradymonadaceae bacterium]